MSLFAELKRRNVFRIAIAYCVVAWLLLQVTDVVAPILQLPDSLPRIVLFLLAIGFIPAVLFAWAFELTPDGVKLESEVDRSKSITSNTARKLDRTIIVVLAFSVTLLLVDKFILQGAPEVGSEPFFAENTSGTVEQVPEGSEPFSQKRALTPLAPLALTPLAPESVAVLPFLAMSNGPDDEYFADGLTEEIINALAQVPDLLVTARTSAFHFKGQNVPVADIAGQLGVDHIVEGSVRRAGNQLRITAQLVRASDGFHLWSETYDRRTEDTLAVQADIAEKVATALNVLLDEEQRALMQYAGVPSVEAYTSFQKGAELFEDAHREGSLFGRLRRANVYFEEAADQYPDFFKAYIAHADLYVHILMAHANGQLDGDITEADINQAPSALRRDYERALQSARNRQSRLWVEYDMAVTLGEWRGLASRAIRTLEAPGCSAGYWSQLASGAFGQAELQFESFRALVQCDPVSHRSWVHMTFASLWMGDSRQAIEIARRGLKAINHQMLASAWVIALTAEEETGRARDVIDSHLLDDNVRLIAEARLAAQIGDSETARTVLEEYLARYGPDDYHSLIIAASRGDRAEANRLAGEIDRRHFGHMALLQAVYYCVCGAPFDLDAVPQFASLLDGSGLSWPPPRTINFPLKDW